MNLKTQIKAYLFVIGIGYVTVLFLEYRKNIKELETLKEQLIKCQTENNTISGGDISKSIK